MGGANHSKIYLALEVDNENHKYLTTSIWQKWSGYFLEINEGKFFLNLDMFKFQVLLSLLHTVFAALNLFFSVLVISRFWKKIQLDIVNTQSSKSELAAFSFIYVIWSDNSEEGTYFIVCLGVF